MPQPHRPTRRLTRSDTAAAITVAILTPLALAVLAIDVVRARAEHPVASAATAPVSMSAAPQSDPPASPSPSPPPASSVSAAPLTTPSAPAVPEPTENVYAAGTSCLGHREGLREWDAARRLLVCTAGTWSFVQPAGTPAPSPSRNG